jgi:hypothetical protein
MRLAAENEITALPPSALFTLRNASAPYPVISQIRSFTVKFFTWTVQVQPKHAIGQLNGPIYRSQLTPIEDPFDFRNQKLDIVVICLTIWGFRQKRRLDKPTEEHTDRSIPKLQVTPPSDPCTEVSNFHFPFLYNNVRFQVSGIQDFFPKNTPEHGAQGMASR